MKQEGKIILDQGRSTPNGQFRTQRAEACLRIRGKICTRGKKKTLQHGWGRTASRDYINTFMGQNYNLIGGDVFWNKTLSLQRPVGGVMISGRGGGETNSIGRNDTRVGGFTEIGGKAEKFIFSTRGRAIRRLRGT